MSDVEKRKLSVELSELQGDQLVGVLDVLQVRVMFGRRLCESCQGCTVWSQACVRVLGFNEYLLSSGVDMERALLCIITGMPHTHTLSCLRKHSTLMRMRMTHSHTHDHAHARAHTCTTHTHT